MAIMGSPRVVREGGIAVYLSYRFEVMPLALAFTFCCGVLWCVGMGGVLYPVELGCQGRGDGAVSLLL
jgi:hypothetical protein